MMNVGVARSPDFGISSSSFSSFLNDDESIVETEISTSSASTTQIGSRSDNDNDNDNEAASSMQFSTVMLADDWRCEGLSAAAQADDSEDLAHRVKLLTRAHYCFGKAGDSALEKKAEEHVKGLRLQQQLLSALSSITTTESVPSVETVDAVKMEKVAALCVSHLLKAGMIDEARDICAAWCSRIRLERLQSRVARLKGKIVVV
jgi:hypothetical protein